MKRERRKLERGEKIKKKRKVVELLNLKKITRKKMLKRKVKDRVFYSIIALVGALAIGSVVHAYSVSNNQIIEGDYNYYEAEGQPEGEVSFGAQSGPDHYQHQRFNQGFSVGCNAYATSSTAANYTLTTNELPLDREDCYVSWNAGLNLALTLPASTTQQFATMKTGDSYSVWFHSATSTTATTITWTAGTGIDLLEPEINGTVIQNGTDMAKVTFLKKADTDVAVITEIFQAGD